MLSAVQASFLALLHQSSAAAACAMSLALHGPDSTSTAEQLNANIYMQLTDHITAASIFHKEQVAHV